MMTLSAELYRSLGALMTEYLNGHRTFEEIETAIANAASTIPEDRELFNDLYHIMNHFEIDEPIRREDLDYAAFTLAKLQSIAASLCNANMEQIKQSISAFWNNR